MGIIVPKPYQPLARFGIYSWVLGWVVFGLGASYLSKGKGSKRRCQFFRAVGKQIL